MLNFTLGYVVYANTYLRRCFRTAKCINPGISAEVFNIFNFILNQVNITLIPKKFASFTSSNGEDQSLYGSLQNGSVATTFPWFHLTYSRFGLYDYVTPPPLVFTDALFVHSFAPASAIKLYTLISPQTYVGFFCLQILACTVLLVARKMKAKQISTLTSMIKVETIDIANVIFDLSFHQRISRFWTSTAERIILATWAICMSKVIMQLIKANYIHTLTATSYPSIKNWNDVTELIKTNNYTLVLSEHSVFYDKVFKSDSHNMVNLRQILTNFKPKIITAQKAVKYLVSNPGSIFFFSNVFAELVVKHYDIKMFLMAAKPNFESMLISRYNFTKRKTLVKYLNEAAGLALDQGFTERILSNYREDRRNLESHDTREVNPLKLMDLVLSRNTLTIGYIVALILFLVEVIREKMAIIL